MLVTERLLMLPLGPEHAGELAEVYADPDVSRSLGAPDADDQCRRFRASWDEHGWGQSALLDKVTGRLVGRAGLHPSFEEVELAVVLRRDRWGQGLAAEACREWLAWSVGRFDHLIAIVDGADVPWAALAARLGFAPTVEVETPLGPKVRWSRSLEV